MNVSNLLSPSTLAQQQLKALLQTTLDQNKLFAAIDDNPELVGAGVTYIDSKYTVVTLREFRPICRRTAINIVLKEPPTPMSLSDHAAELLNRPHESKLLLEGMSATIACTGAVLSWLVIIGSSASIPLTFGASGALTVIAYSAAAASTAQCMVGGARTYLEVKDPEQLHRLDSNDWYNYVMLALDGISLVGAAASGYATIKYLSVLTRNGSTTLRQALGQLSRPQRRRLTEEIVRMNNPGASTRMLKEMLRAEDATKRFTSQQINEATKRRLKDALAASLGFTGSAVGGLLRKAGSLAVGVYEEIE